MSVDRTKEEIATWCVEFVVKALDIDPSKVGISQEFEAFGLDSVVAVSLAVELEEWLGRSVEPSLLFEFPTIAALSAHLAGEPA